MGSDIMTQNRCMNADGYNVLFIIITQLSLSHIAVSQSANRPNTVNHRQENRACLIQPSKLGAMYTFFTHKSLSLEPRGTQVLKSS